MGHESLRLHWSVIFQEMAALSTPTPLDDPNVLTDEPTGSHPTARAGGRARPAATKPAARKPAPRKTPAGKTAALA